jgi:hypothetical protein
VIAVRGVDELGGDPDSIADLSNAPLHHRGHIQGLTDLADVRRLSLERERRRAGGNPKPRHLTEGVRELLRHAVAEVLLVRVRTHVQEREHRDRCYTVGDCVRRARGGLRGTSRRGAAHALGGRGHVWIGRRPELIAQAGLMHVSDPQRAGPVAGRVQRHHQAHYRS